MPGGEGHKRAATAWQDWDPRPFAVRILVAHAWRATPSAGGCGAKDQVSRACPSSPELSRAGSLSKEPL
jgi:hypothetical protein